MHKVDFRPPSPPNLGGEYIQSPPELGSQCGLGEDWSRRFPPAKEVRVSPSRASSVDLGGIAGFMQETPMNWRSQPRMKMDFQDRSNDQQ
jgi:hypothetical protein